MVKTRKEDTHMPPRTLIRLMALVLASALALSGCAARNDDAEFSQLSAICELATLKCYYHNVAEYVNGTDSLLHFGYKKIWIEYAGIVTIGIDASKVRASKPDPSGVVQVAMPQAEILSVDFDEDSIAEVTETGLLASVTAKEKTNTLAYAQADMEKTASENASLRAQAEQRARYVVQEYIERVGAALGKTYTVQWVDAA